MLLLLHVSPCALRPRQGPSCPVGLFLPLEELQFSLEETADADGLEIVRDLCALLCCLLLLLRCGLDPVGSCAPQLFLLQHPLRLVANGSRLRSHRGSSPASSSPGRDAPPAILPEMSRFPARCLGYTTGRLRSEDPFLVVLYFSDGESV